MAIWDDGKRKLRQITDEEFAFEKKYQGGWIDEVRRRDEVSKLEKDKEKWDVFTEWLLKCLRGEKDDYWNIFDELPNQINFEELQCYRKESKNSIIARIEMNLCHNMCFRIPFTSKAKNNSFMKGQYKLQKLNTIFQKYLNGGKCDKTTWDYDGGFDDKELKSLQDVFEWITRPPTNDQRTHIRKNVGIGAHWNKFLSWDYLECYDKTNGITPSVDDVEKRAVAIQACVDALINSVKNSEIEFSGEEVNLLTKTAKDFLCKKLFGKKITNKALLSFSDRLKQHLETECESNFQRLNKESIDKLYNRLEETQTDWNKIEYLFEKTGNIWKARKIEDTTLEFKESFFHDMDRAKNEFDSWEKKISGELTDEETKLFEKTEKQLKKYLHIKDKPETFEEFDTLKQNFVEHRIRKNICSLINTEGGKLFIGANDDGELIGLDRDCERENYALKDMKKFLSKMNQKWTNKILGESGFEEFQTYIKQTAIPIASSKKWIYLIEVDYVPDPSAYLMEERGSIFYVRDGDGTNGRDYDAFKRWKRHRVDFH